MNTELGVITSGKDTRKKFSHGKRVIGISVAGGFVAGLLVMGLGVWFMMPGMMIVTEESRLGFDETVEALGDAVVDSGWVSPGVTDMQASLDRHGEPFPHRVKIVKLCKPEYASDILKTDRFVSCMMPCSIAVWEDDDGKVFVSKMNTGLMGKMFGGNISRIMGEKVAQDEVKILESVRENRDLGLRSVLAD